MKRKVFSILIISILQGVSTALAQNADQNPPNKHKVNPHSIDSIYKNAFHVFFLNQEPNSIIPNNEHKRDIQYPQGVDNRNLLPPNIYHIYLNGRDKTAHTLEISKEDEGLYASQNSLLDDLPPLNSSEQLKQLIRVKRAVDGIGVENETRQTLVPELDISNKQTVLPDTSNKQLVLPDISNAQPEDIHLNQIGHHAASNETDTTQGAEVTQTNQDDDGFVSTVQEMIAMIDEQLKNKTNTILKRIARQNDPEVKNPAIEVNNIATEVNNRSTEVNDLSDNIVDTQRATVNTTVAVNETNSERSEVNTTAVLDTTDNMRTAVTPTTSTTDTASAVDNTIHPKRELDNFTGVISPGNSSSLQEDSSELHTLITSSNTELNQTTSPNDVKATTITTNKADFLNPALTPYQSELNKTTTSMKSDLEKTTTLIQPEFNKTTPIKPDLNEAKNDLLNKTTTSMKSDLEKTTTLNQPEFNKTTPIKPDLNEAENSKRYSLNETVLYQLEQNKSATPYSQPFDTKILTSSQYGVNNSLQPGQSSIEHKHPHQIKPITTHPVLSELNAETITNRNTSEESDSEKFDRDHDSHMRKLNEERFQDVAKVSAHLLYGEDPFEYKVDYNNSDLRTNDGRIVFEFKSNADDKFENDSRERLVYPERDYFNHVAPHKGSILSTILYIILLCVLAYGVVKLRRRLSQQFPQWFRRLPPQRSNPFAIPMPNIYSTTTTTNHVPLHNTYSDTTNHIPLINLASGHHGSNMNTKAQHTTHGL
ncbi:hypothetical protein M8J75_001884 [Diaphorina citri]|nr:hypothetical protein M8J75_001884 [Diaphorina citri]